MTRSFIAVLALLAGTLGCSSSGLTTTVDDGQQVLRAVQFSHPIGILDQLTLRKYGRLVAVVQLDSTALLMTSSYDQIRALPGVTFVGPSLGTSDTVHLEFGVRARDSSVATAESIVSQIGQTAYSPYHGFVSGIAAANHLGELDNFASVIAYAWYNYDPDHDD
ncbi:MAG TPA: hypothetical protein VGM20_06155 [Gemmatimonadales bacterium]